MLNITDIDEIKGHVRYPLPPTAFSQWADEMDIYVRFMRQVRTSAYTKAEHKIFSGIQVAGAATHRDDAHVAMMLIDLGLRAPRGAFPAEFLCRIDAAITRAGQVESALSTAVADLLEHWQRIDGGGMVAVGTACLPGAAQTGYGRLD